MIDLRNSILIFSFSLKSIFGKTILVMNWHDVSYILIDNARNYFAIAGLAFIIFYVIMKKKIFFKKIQLRFVKRKDYIREIIYSVVSIMIFTLPPVIMLKNDAIRPYTTYYSDISMHGLIYFFAAFQIMLFCE